MPNLNEDSVVVAIMNILEDLEEEKNLIEVKVNERTKSLKETYSRFISSVNSLSVGFVLTDTKNNIILKNPAIVEILSFSDDFSTIDRIADYLKSGIDLLATRDKCLKDKKIIEIETIEIDKKFLRMSIAPVFLSESKEGEVIGCVFLIEDTTEETASRRSREDFFALASHELRTPLTAIRGNMALLKEFLGEKIKNPEIMEMIDDSYGASVRLIGVVNDFLDATRLEQNRVEFNKTKFNIIDLLQDVLRETSGIAKSKNLTLSLKDSEKNEYIVLSDRNRLKQVIYNLVANALNYTQKGQILIDVKKKGNMLDIFITDTGIGIATQKQSLLFRKFQQAGEVFTRDVSKGTGLGLYISKLIIESLGGNVWLEKSEIGKGSVFALAIPLSD